jgi:hypothetical protein
VTTYRGSATAGNGSTVQSDAEDIAVEDRVSLLKLRTPSMPTLQTQQIHTKLSQDL